VPFAPCFASTRRCCGLSPPLLIATASRARAIALGETLPARAGQCAQPLSTSRFSFLFFLFARVLLVTRSELNPLGSEESWQPRTRSYECCITVASPSRCGPYTPHTFLNLATRRCAHNAQSTPASSSHTRTHNKLRQPSFSSFILPLLPPAAAVCLQTRTFCACACLSYARPFCAV
jgi:hypothetical protein